MSVIVTVSHVDRYTTHFEVEGDDLPEVIEDFLDARLSASVEAGWIFTASYDGQLVVVNHDDTAPSDWYVKVIDAVKDCFDGDHEVLSRMANWP